MGWPEPGATLGRWTLGRRLHAGPRAAVYLAAAPRPPASPEDDPVDDLVALKVVRAERRAALVGEALLLRRLSRSPRVVRALEGLEAEVDGTPGAALALELAALGDARRAAPTIPDARYPEARALALAADAAEGLAGVHALGFVHADLSPAAILVASDGRAVLGGLGHARVADGPLAPRGLASLPLSPAFAAPEALEGRPHDVRSDVYALGATLHALLAGRDPFEGASPLIVAGRALAGPVPDVRARAPEVTERTATLVAAATALRPSARPTIAAFAAEARTIWARLGGDR